MIKLLLAGLGVKFPMGNRDKRVSPHTQERLRFEEGVREQFLKLKEKGISIPVFTL